MKASTEQELEKKTADFERKPAHSGDRKMSVAERKGSISQQRRNSIAPMPKKPMTGAKAAQQLGHSLTGMLATKKFFKRFSKRERTSSTVTVPPKEYEFRVFGRVLYVCMAIFKKLRPFEISQRFPPISLRCQVKLRLYYASFTTFVRCGNAIKSRDVKAVLLLWKQKI